MRIGKSVAVAACVVLGWLGLAGTATASNDIHFDIAELEQVVQASQSMIGEWESSERVVMKELNMCDRVVNEHNAEMQLIVNLVREWDGAHSYRIVGGQTFTAGPGAVCKRVKTGWVIETNGQYKIRAVYEQIRMSYHGQPASGWEKTEAAFNPCYVNPSACINP